MDVRTLGAAVLAAAAAAAQDWRWVTATGPTPGSWSMVRDEARGRLVLVSEATSSALVADTWLFDGATWTRSTPATTPPARSGHCLSYDPGRGVVLLFGGGNPAPLAVNLRNDLWEWNGTDWRQLHPSSSPSPRRGMRMVHDAARGVHLLFGGETVVVPMNYVVSGETWTWDGTSWLLAASAPGPQPRTDPGLVDDPARARVVLFGGGFYAGPHFRYEVLGDTWAWDGSRWTELAVPVAPPARSQCDLAWDGGRQVAVLHGGHAGLGLPYHADTWEWDGAEWYRYQANQVPAATGRTGMGMAFLPQLAGVVGFGGQDLLGGLGDTWQFGGALPAVAGYGAPCQGTSGPLELTARNLPALRTTLALQAAGVPGNAFTLFAASLGTLRVALPGTTCEVRVQLPLAVAATYGNGGIAGYTTSIPYDPALRGLIVHFQAGTIDPGANAAGVVLSSALRAVVQ